MPGLRPVICLIVCGCCGNASADWSACRPSPEVASELAAVPEPAGWDYVGELQRAVPDLNALAERRPRDVFVWNRLMPALRTLARKSPAGFRARFDAVVREAPADPLALYLAGTAAVVDDPAAAEALLNRSIEHAPDFPWPSLQAARMHSNQPGRGADAVRHARRLTMLCPDRIEGYAAYAQTLDESLEARQAASRYRALIAALDWELRPLHLRALWDWESNLAAEGRSYRRRLAAELESIEKAAARNRSAPSRAWTTVLAYGWRLAGDPAEADRLEQAFLAGDRAEEEIPPVAEYQRQIGKFYRLRGAAPLADSREARQAYWRSLFEATEEWIRRWPLREFAWRDRLRAAAELEDLEPAVAEETGLRALRAIAAPSNVDFRYETRLLAATTFARHGVRFSEAEQLARDALDSDRRRERLDAARILADLAERSGDRENLEEALVRLDEMIGDRPASTDREGLLLWASAKRDLYVRMAATANVAETWVFYRRALDVRPIHEGREAQPQNAAAVAAVKRAWHAADLPADSWNDWLGKRPGVLVPAARKGSLSWRSEETPLPWAEPAAVLRIVAVWRPGAQLEAQALNELARAAAIEPGLALSVVSAERNRLILETAVEAAGLRMPVRRVRFADVKNLNRMHPTQQVWLVDADGMIRRVADLDVDGDHWVEMVLAEARML